MGLISFHPFHIILIKYVNITCLKKLFACNIKQKLFDSLRSFIWKCTHRPLRSLCKDVYYFCSLNFKLFVITWAKVIQRSIWYYQSTCKEKKDLPIHATCFIRKMYSCYYYWFKKIYTPLLTGNWKKCSLYVIYRMLV